jgi:hypothetical protein
MCMIFFFKSFFFHLRPFFDTLPSSLIDSNVNLKLKKWKSKELNACFLVRSTLGVEGHVGASK